MKTRERTRTTTGSTLRPGDSSVYSPIRQVSFYIHSASHPIHIPPSATELVNSSNSQLCLTGNLESDAGTSLCVGGGRSRPRRGRTQHGAAGTASAGRAGAGGTGIGNLLLLVGGGAAADGRSGTARGSGRRGTVDAGAAGSSTVGGGGARRRLGDHSCQRNKTHRKTTPQSQSNSIKEIDSP